MFIYPKILDKFNKQTYGTFFLSASFEWSPFDCLIKNPQLQQVAYRR